MERNEQRHMKETPSTPDAVITTGRELATAVILNYGISHAYERISLLEFAATHISLRMNALPLDQRAAHYFALGIITEYTTSQEDPITLDVHMGLSEAHQLIEHRLRAVDNTTILTHVPLDAFGPEMQEAIDFYVFIARKQAQDIILAYNQSSRRKTLQQFAIDWKEGQRVLQPRVEFGLVQLATQAYINLYTRSGSKAPKVLDLTTGSQVRKEMILLQNAHPVIARVHLLQDIMSGKTKHDRTTRFWEIVTDIRTHVPVEHIPLEDLIPMVATIMHTFIMSEHFTIRRKEIQQDDRAMLFTNAFRAWITDFCTSLSLTQRQNGFSHAAVGIALNRENLISKSGLPIEIIPKVLRNLAGLVIYRRELPIAV